MLNWVEVCGISAFLTSNTHQSIYKTPLWAVKKVRVLIINVDSVVYVYGPEWLCIEVIWSIGIDDFKMVWLMLDLPPKIKHTFQKWEKNQIWDHVSYI